MAEGAKIEAAECLGQRNRKLVADERSPERDSGHDSGRLDPRSCSNSSVTEFRPPTESSEPCSHSIRKAENPSSQLYIRPVPFNEFLFVKTSR